MVRFASKLTLVLGLCAAIALANAANQAAASTKPEVICKDGSCYPRIFRPTTEFQEVLDGQEIPGGLHVQMDFETHKKYAKLMDPEDVDHNDPTNSVLVVDTDTPGTFQHSVGSNMPPPIDLQHPNGESDFAQLEEDSRMNLQAAFDSIPELAHLRDEPVDHQQQDKTNEYIPPVPFNKQSEHQVFTEQLEVIKTSRDNDKVLSAMDELADLASDMDFGLRLASGEGLKALVSHLHCRGKTDAECEDARLIRSKSALIIGTSVQNHEKAQNAAFKSRLHKILLARLETETDVQVQRRLIFAYGSLVRGGSNNAFIQDEDIRRLAAVYNKSTDATFKRKCVYLMSDFADPDMQFVKVSDVDNTKDGESKDSNQTKFLTMIDKIDLDVGPWCETLQQENKSSEYNQVHEDWEIIERAVDLLHASYPDTCILTNSKLKDEL
ncbi:hypothetical protein BGZ98_009485 [Dissophora globulifera]|nr:hypothetical protein BGZ98_009485 [Dissophora globulifera]